MVIITRKRSGDTAVWFGAYSQMKAELELLKTLAEAEDDVKNDRLAPIQHAFDDLRDSLLGRKNT